SLELIAHARYRHYRYRIGAMVGLGRAKRQVHVAPSVDEEGQTFIPPRVLGYDTLVIAVGSMSNDFGTPGVWEHAIALDTLDQAARFNRRRSTPACAPTRNMSRSSPASCMLRSSVPAPPASNWRRNCTNRCAISCPTISTASASTCRSRSS
ncbi:MAG: hypothetical protein WBL55_28650, partial [Xanthobacteraceae bacterium]